MKESTPLDIIRSQLTLTSSKLATDKMTALVSNVELSIMSVLFVTGELLQSELMNIIDRDETTIRHNIRSIICKGYVSRRSERRGKLLFLKLTPAGAAIYTQYIINSARKREKIQKLMPKTHVERAPQKSENPPNG